MKDGLTEIIRSSCLLYRSVYYELRNTMKNYELLKDIQLVEEIRNDNYIAFEILFNRYKGKVYYFIIDISGGDYYMAEEIVQQVFIKLWEVRKNINVTKTFSAYLFSMSRNYFLNAVTKKAQEQLFMSRIQDNKEEKEAEDSVNYEVEFNLLLEDLEKIVEKLPPARRNVYRLRYFEHLSQKEIASQLNLSENTIESHIRLSNKFVREMLQNKYGNLNLWLSFLILLIGC